ncbi:MAG: DUF2281 domain-containing protein [Calditrichaeota bacterium]|nr:DUF2281 domain-containing protein [Calditrichota bacterium]
MKITDLEAKIEKLPSHVIHEVNDFIEFLLKKYGAKEIDENKFSFNWEGGLFKLKNKYSSVELQHRRIYI